MRLTMLKHYATLWTLLTATLAVEADDGIETFEVQPGFRVELVAAEPLLRDPIAMAFDEHGRLFVVKYPEYNQGAEKGSSARIMYDGVYDPILSQAPRPLPLRHASHTR